MDRQPTLETERLTIRPMTEADREPLYAIASDPMIWEQHPIHDRWKREVFDAFFDEGMESGGALAIVRKSDGQILGSSQYKGFDPDDGGSIEVGWTYLDRSCWGKGINPEMKRAMLAHAFQDLATVRFRVGDTNYRSRNALEAIGAVRTERYELAKYQGKRIVHLVYEISRDDFENGPLMRS
ncbi:GNAT family N-acetyltransferase [Qipengyuania sp. RANM35]|uniref:GNAT family N-acetyltransferase n=1 Tax=Qipengyuania sp. RANM35 TaxID=3068635 RepID=UPI0034DB3A1A